MLHYRLALLAASGASFAAIHFHGCNGKSDGDAKTISPAPTPTPGPDGPTPAPTPPGPSPPGPSPGPPGPSPPGPNPDPWADGKWTCKEHGKNACGALSDEDCEEVSGGACWVDKLGQKNNRHGRTTGCTVRYCWYHTDEDSCLGTKDCAWDPNYEEPNSVDNRNPDFRREGSACYSCSMQGKWQTDDLPKGCPDDLSPSGVTRFTTSEYDAKAREIWTQCGDHYEQ